MTKTTMDLNFISFWLLDLLEYSACMGNIQSVTLWEDSFVEYAVVIYEQPVFLCEDKREKKKITRINGWLLGTIYLGFFLNQVPCQQCYANVGTTWSNISRLFDQNDRRHHRAIYREWNFIWDICLFWKLQLLLHCASWNRLQMSCWIPQKIGPRPWFLPPRVTESICCLCDKFFPNGALQYLLKYFLF